MGHWWSDFVYKCAGWFAFAMSFVEQNVALLSFLLAVVSFGIRTYYDRRENARKEELHHARLKQLERS